MDLFSHFNYLFKQFQQKKQYINETESAHMSALNQAHNSESIFFFYITIRIKTNKTRIFK